jgi:hypothetical protein
MRNHIRVIQAAMLALSFVGAGNCWAHSKSAYHDDMRKLWEDHVAWTRLYIISVAGGLPDAKLTADRLLSNQVDIGNAVTDFYGAEAAGKLTALLKDHILIAADLVGAAKAGEETKVSDAKTRWYANANDIAEFLNKANPKQWPLATLQSAMKMHLDQTLDEATHRLQGNFDQDIKDYDGIVEHILKMADILSDGIIAQFPKKFDKP